MYANGKGVVQDEAEAVRWFRLAAEQGHVVAQYDLGCSYRDGRGVAQDDVTPTGGSASRRQERPVTSWPSVSTYATAPRKG